ncbi:hypothetical protein V5O48_003972 [Marasmius crinis-equi]|uniref:SGT1-domain-containing protein n=1 Tax=Marasmius crinis-equi TaxID=585013 RepID=A0ABR3FRE8_9AGAR
MMEIFNRVPSISEDTLHYRLFPLKTEAHDKLSATTLAACIHTLVQSLLPPEFLWHRDAFELKVSLEDSTQEWFFEGRMRVGDCVDDEWCVVWLLREISAKWDLAISVNDTDGEFLLIEAADALPSWLKPSNSANRVWIYNSQLHLIDLIHVSASSKIPRRERPSPDSDDENDEVEDFLAVDDALKLLRDPLTDTSAPSAVKNTVWQRISQYPAAARQHVHFTKAYIPQDIAKALYVEPSLIQKATEAFYTRDAIQLRAAHRMSRFPPSTSVLATVRMTRTAYAQLLGQKFYPPKVFGRWQENESTKERRWRDVGMKIYGQAVGFEMLYQESKGRSESINRSAEGLKSMSDSVKEHLEMNADYQKYLQNLTSLNYFRGEMKGSLLWKELEDKAISVFLSSQKQDEAARPSFTALVSSAISRAPGTLLTSSQDEDDDSWLNIDAESFEDALAKAQSKRPADPNAMDVDSTNEITAEDRVASEQAARLRDLAAKVEEFVEGEGDLEGARFKDELLSDEEISDDGDTSEEEAEPRRNQQQRQADMDQLVPGLDPSEYGKMPASFHSNSQKVLKTTLETDVMDETASSQPSVGPSTSRPMRKPILPRDKFDGVDSDDETDEDDEEEEEEEDEKPQVVGEIEVDMDEEEDEFLEFSRQALGISDEQWKSIIKDRQDRGAYVPKEIRTDNRAGAPKPSAPDPKVDEDSLPQNNPNLDSFEALMKAMDAELRRSTQGSEDKGKGKGRASNDEVDIEAMMAEELQGALERDDEDEDNDLGDANIDYNLIKNFLESFKSQGGLSGPVGNLAGRLQPGWKLPRDEGDSA